MTCNTCVYWKPKEWAGWQYIDEEAYCEIIKRNTSALHSCESASITKTEVISEDLELYEHQKEAVEFFDTKEEIALFFEMGVGKSATVLTIAANKFKRGEIDALLVVAPNDVHKQWAVEQVPLWLKVPYEIQCLYGRGGQKQAYSFDDDSKLHVVCVNIDTFSTPSKWKDVVAWANSKQTFIVLDEATTIKNVNAQRTQRMLYEFNNTVRRGRTILQTERLSVARAILTGTPVTNGAMDLWAMMEFLKPNFFGRNWYSFQNYYGMFTRLAVNNREINVPLTAEWWTAIKECTTYGKAYAICGCTEDTYNTIQNQAEYEGPYKHAEELKELIKPVSIFKTLTDCVDMPPQIYNTRTITMNDAQQACYNSMVDEFIATYANHVATAANKMSVMMRLQQISSGFICDKTIEDEDTDIVPDEIVWLGKTIPKLEALYRDVEELSKPLIIITRFTAEASRIYDDLKDKYSCCLVTGWKRVGTIDEFKEGKYQIMVANIAAIARGHNLQISHVVCFYSNTFSLEYRLQAEGRIFRINQQHPCEYVDYINEGTVDEKIVSALQLKRKLLDYMRSVDVEEMICKK